MTDQELARLARRAARLDAKAKELSSQASDLKTEIRDEMAERETTQLVTGGFQITHVRPESVKYDQQKLQRLLTRRGGEELWDRCQARSFSVTQLMALVQEGDVPLSTVERCSSVEPGTPYVRITARPAR